MSGVLGQNLTQCSIRTPFCVGTITFCCGDAPAAIVSIILLILKVIGFICLAALIVGCAVSCCIVVCVVAGTCGGIALCGACVSARSRAPLSATDRTALLAGEHRDEGAAHSAIHSVATVAVVPVAAAAPIVAVATAVLVDGAVEKAERMPDA